MPKHKQIAPGKTPAEQIAELRRWIKQAQLDVSDLHAELASPVKGDSLATKWAEVNTLRSDIAEWEAEIKRLEQSPPARGPAE